MAVWQFWRLRRPSVFFTCTFDEAPVHELSGDRIGFRLRYLCLANIPLFTVLDHESYAQKQAIQCLG